MKLWSETDAIFSGLTEDVKSSHQEVGVCHLEAWKPSQSVLTIAVAENLEPLQVVTEVYGKKINHLVQKNEGRFSQDLLMTGQLMEKKADYFLPGYVVFAEAVKDSVLLPFSGPDDKEDMKDRALYFIDKTKSGAVSQAAESIIEELYMNAVIDAPREALKKNWSLATEKCQLFVAWGDKSLQISCTDPHGSLEISKLLARMNEVYVRGAGETINLDAPGGAGLGCVMLFENSSCLMLGVQPQKMTKVTCIVPLGMSSRQRAQMKKSLHWFQF